MEEGNRAQNEITCTQATNSSESQKNTRPEVRVSLSEIASENNIVLVDGCGCYNFAEDRRGFCRKIYNTNKKTGIERDILACASMSISDLVNILEQGSVYTIPEVVQELRGMLEAIGSKCSFFNENTTFNRRQRRRANAVNNSRERLSALQQKAYSVIKLARSKDIRWCPDLREILEYEQKFDAILNMVKFLNEKIRLKRDTSVLYGEHKRDASRESDTDERLVAHAYCISMLSNKKPIILTGDTDLIRLLGVTPKLMGADNFVPDNEFFRKRLGENPFWLCFNDNVAPGDYSLVINGSEGYNFSKDFRILNTTEEENTKITNKMKGFWEEFNKK
ncbi:MAG: hypothetical protein QXD13_01205 [Candidatus Pacearchaeota archaeon]